MKAIRATICQYDVETDKKIAEFSGTLNVILKKIPNFKNYYYRMKKFEYTSKEKITDTYFNVKVSDIGSLEINEADYINKRLNYFIKYFVDENSKPLKANGIFHNLLYWHFIYIYRVTSRLYINHDEFNNVLNEFLKENPSFIEVKDLNEVKNVNGIYLMVLDKYSGYYIGQSRNVKKRIQRHWYRRDYFTGTGIDLYKAKDTTRIYVLPVSESDLDTYEKLYIKKLSKYTLNVLPGGINFSDSELFEYLNRDGQKRLSLSDTLKLIEENPDVFL